MKAEKRDKQVLVAWLKNGYIFLLKLWNDKNFVIQLKHLVDRWPSQYREQPLGYAWDFDLDQIAKNISQAKLQRAKFVSSLKEIGKVVDFNREIKTFLQSNELGQEWFIPITDYIISAWLYPPNQNFYLSEEGTHNKKRLIITLNPSASLEDIKAVWPEIKQRQKLLWPEFKKNNLTSKSFRNLEIAVADLRERLLKDSGPKSDEELVGKIWEDVSDDSAGADKKRRDNLRHIRKRFKSKSA